MLSFTVGQPETAYMSDGRNGDMDRVLWPLNAGFLRICGYDVLPPFIAWSVPWVGDDGRQAILDQYRERLLNLDSLEPLFFHSLSDIGEDHRIKPDV